MRACLARTTLSAQRWASRCVYSDAHHYRVLGLDPGASAADVHRAFLAAARETHPDLAPATGAAQAAATARFQEVNAAFEALQQARVGRQWLGKASDSARRERQAQRAQAEQARQAARVKQGYPLGLLLLLGNLLLWNSTRGDDEPPLANGGAASAGNGRGGERFVDTRASWRAAKAAVRSAEPAAASAEPAAEAVAAGAEAAAEPASGGEESAEGGYRRYLVFGPRDAARFWSGERTAGGRGRDAPAAAVADQAAAEKVEQGNRRGPG